MKTLEEIVKEQLGGLLFLLCQKEVELGQLREEKSKLEAELLAVRKSDELKGQAGQEAKKVEVS